MDTDTAWQLWGLRDPYFSVLTDQRFRSAVMTQQAKEEFFSMGRHHVHYVLDTCRRVVDPAFHPRRILDFGCGVGRLVIPFAALAEDVVGMDVAPSMLEEARRNCAERGAGNVSLVASDDALSLAEGSFDLVHSCIVLQHIEVPRGRVIFRALVDKVAPGGCGAIHATFALDAYSETFGQTPLAEEPPPPSRRPLIDKVRQAVRPLRRPAELASQPMLEDQDPEMQMNYYNLSELMFILQQVGVAQCHSEFTNHGGALGAFLFFQKPLGVAQK